MPAQHARAAALERRTMCACAARRGGDRAGPPRDASFRVLEGLLRGSNAVRARAKSTNTDASTRHAGVTPSPSGDTAGHGAPGLVIPRTKPASARKVASAHAPSLQSPIDGVCGPPLRGQPRPLGPSWVHAAQGSRGLGSGSALNLAVFSDAACAVHLCLFDAAGLEAGVPIAEVTLDPRLNRTGRVWHIALPLSREDLFYAFRVDARTATSTSKQQQQASLGAGSAHAKTSAAAPPPPSASSADAAAGPSPEGAAGAALVASPAPAWAMLLDPYAPAVASRGAWGELASRSGGGLAAHFGPCWAQHAAAIPPLSSALAPFDWEGDVPLRLPMEDLVIYELHVRGFTRHESSGLTDDARGTFAGLAAKLDHLESLGVNCVELMPVHEFNELEYYEIDPSNGVHRYNVWGYSTVGFFAPMARYAACVSAGGVDATYGAVDEFRELVKACHKRGIEVILDVVFNHTAEGNERGPSLSFRGLGNRVYYMLAPEGEYYNYSGCGNTFNCNHPVAREFILDCLRYWVVEMHVDGFRFDLASIMSRNHSRWAEDAIPPGTAGTSAAPGVGVGGGQYVHDVEQPTGMPLADPPLLQSISSDPLLKHTKLIAEAWDCDGLNQVGSFPHYGGRWSEWNGVFRDCVRQFIKGADGPWAGAFAGAICGSPGVYGTTQPAESDWWGNNDGHRWRGSRGPSASINFVTAHDGFTLADLVSYNQKHNEANGEANRDGEEHNNSWNCGEEGPTEDAAVARLRARQVKNFAVALMVSQGVPMLVMGDEYGHSKGGNNNTYCHDGDINYFQWDVCAKHAGLTRFFSRLIHLRRKHSIFRQPEYLDGQKIQWHGVQSHAPDWSDESRLVAFTLHDGAGEAQFYVAFNSGHEAKTLTLPSLSGGGAWDVLCDTSKAAPFDFLEADDALSAEDMATAKTHVDAFLAEGTYPVCARASIILRRTTAVGRPGNASPVEDFSITSTAISLPATPHPSDRASKPKRRGARKQAARKPKSARGAKGRAKVKGEGEGKGKGDAMKGTKDVMDETMLKKAMEENRKLRMMLEKKRQRDDERK